MTSIRIKTKHLILAISFMAGMYSAMNVIGQEFDEELATQATEILNDYCKGCHGDGSEFPSLDVTDRAGLLLPNGRSDQPFLVPGDHDASRIWARINASTGQMPPDQMPQMSDEQKDTIKRWISDGAYFPEAQRKSREFVGEQTILELIDEDLRVMDEDDIQYMRYFSLYHLWNHTEGLSPVTDEDFRYYRAAVSKLINSLSTKPSIVVPRIVDEGYGTLMAIDLRDYGWTSWHWERMMGRYPYGMKATGSAGRVGQRVYNMLGTKIPYMRGDWFAYYASRPPLYHDLLNIPKNAKALEADLGVDIYKNFVDNSLMRAAFDGRVSGVSDQNRMVERHSPTNGARFFWKSYDILPEGAADRLGDFTRSPLGPEFEQFEGHQTGAFEHDGGEIIYALPNGLQAYMLVDGKDQRIDAGPLDVVHDRNRHSGTPLIVNGISCMGCHHHGMIKWRADFVRPVYEDRAGEVMADKVLRLFPEDDEFEKFVDADAEHFMGALREATEGLLMDGHIQRESESMTKFYGDLLNASDIDYDQQKLSTFVSGELGKPGMMEMDRKQLVIQMVTSANKEFDWDVSLDDTVAMYEINPIKNGTGFVDFHDPVTKLSKMYGRDINIYDVALELGLPGSEAEAEARGMKTVEQLKFMCGLKQFENLGLASLAQEGGTITRLAWENAYGRVAREMGSGIPVTRIQD